MSRRAYWMVVTSLLALALQGCGGGGGSSSDSGATAAVSEDNALSVAQAGTEATSETGSNGDGLTDVASTLSATSGSSTATADGGEFTTQETVVNCDSGTLTYNVLSSSSGSTKIEYTANSCITGGQEFDGTMVLTVGTWDKYPSNSSESFLETEGPFKAGECTLDGVFGFRVYSEFPDNYPNDFAGTWKFEFEYGTSTDRGLSLTCPDPEDNLEIAADTVLNNVVTYTVDSNGDVTGSSFVTTASGGFESPDGDGTLVFTTNNLEYQADETDANAEFGAQSCPSGGSITITGADDNEVTVYFGDDAGGTGDVVQVEGPNGYLETYTSCSDFLNATP